MAPVKVGTLPGAHTTPRSTRSGSSWVTQIPARLTGQTGARGRQGWEWGLRKGETKERSKGAEQPKEKPITSCVHEATQKGICLNGGPTLLGCVNIHQAGVVSTAVCLLACSENMGSNGQ
eukprot:scaffold97936_cov21-Tisochrysis_lutea.AAC.4